jgi:hypothetical protein
MSSRFYMLKMFLVATVLVLKLLLQVEGGCPVKCTCTENSVTCVSRNLEYVPYFESLTNNPLIIDVSGNAISIVDIDDFSFDKSDQVKEIYLNSTQLITIEEKAFEELENLQELYLGDNLLNTLPENFLSNNDNLILLDISNNYFTEMPKITSDSLELLAIAKSGVTKISTDALEGLPNLRVLLLQQNNLKSINPVIFNQMGHLFFVRLAYNPWECNCKTIKLFNYLTGKKFVDLTEPVQCQNADEIFVDIYDYKGVADAFKQECNDANNQFVENELKVKSVERVEKLIDLEDSDVTTVVTSTEECVTQTIDPDYMYFTDFYYSLILCSAIILSLIVGASCGTCLTFRYMNSKMSQTESKNELLSRTDKYEVIFDSS